MRRAVAETEISFKSSIKSFERDGKLLREDEWGGEIAAEYLHDC